MIIHPFIRYLLVLSFVSRIAFASSFSRNQDTSASINDLLLEKAIPLEVYEKRHIASGGKPFSHEINNNGKFDKGESITRVERTLFSWWSHNNNKNGYNSKSFYYSHSDDGYYNEENADDFFNRNYAYSFDGYSLKFATCQKVQRFSVDAIKRGEYSSMVADDIVIMRLCPSTSCSSYAQYGCSSGYGEYALTASEYMAIIMKYNIAKMNRFQSFCKICQKGSGWHWSYNAKACYIYSNECNNYYNSNDDDDANGDGDSVYSKYLEYMDCPKMAYNGNYYYVKPSCDSDGKISMGIYYDSYCSQDAGDNVNVATYLGNDFDFDVFAKLQDIDCLDCSESKYGPFYNTHNQLCNKIYKHSGKCNTYLSSSLGTQNDDDYEDDNKYSYSQNTEQNQCSYMESIRYGTYDTYGQIYTSNSQSSSQKAMVTPVQKYALIMVSMICFGLALYAYHLHRQMTKLLLKTLSSGLISTNRRSSSRGRGTFDVRPSSRGSTSRTRSSSKSRLSSKGRSPSRKQTIKASNKRHAQNDYSLNNDDHTLDSQFSSAGSYA